MKKIPLRKNTDDDDFKGLEISHIDLTDDEGEILKNPTPLKLSHLPENTSKQVTAISLEGLGKKSTTITFSGIVWEIIKENKKKVKNA